MAHNVHGWEGILEVECNHPSPAGDLTGMMEEDPVEGRTVPSCCSCCVSVKARDLEGDHARYNLCLPDPPRNSSRNPPLSTLELVRGEANS